MPALLLDTTVLIDVLRGAPAADRLRALRREGAVPYICAVNVDEIARGIRPREELNARRLLRALRLAPLGQSEAWRAGAWRREFAELGVTLSQPDCMVASAAVGVGATLATGNLKDFPMPGLSVEHWPVGA